METKQKKGIALNQAFGAVLTVILVAILIVIALVLFSSLQTSTSIPNTAATVINESTFINQSGDFLNNYQSQCFGNPTITNAINGSNNTQPIASSNWTLNGAGNLVNATSNTWNNVNASYTFTYCLSTGASNASGTLITQFSTFPTLVGLVGTITLLGIIIGVLVASFVFGGRKNGA